LGAPNWIGIALELMPAAEKPPDAIDDNGHAI
jgi:hypothetical protein